MLFLDSTRSTMNSRWAFVTLFFPMLAQADDLESRMQRCQWGLTESYMPEFRQARRRLPQEIQIVLKSCDAGGPTYKLKSKQGMVELQDGWLEGDQSTAYFYSPAQIASKYWTFEYHGYEWSGVTFIHKITGKGSNTPCNQVAAMHYNPEGSRAIFMCTPAYGEDRVELFSIVLTDTPRFLRLSATPPGSDISVVWKSETLATVNFLNTAKKIPARQYNIPN